MQSSLRDRGRSCRAASSSISSPSQRHSAADFFRQRPFNLREILIEQSSPGFTKNTVTMNDFLGRRAIPGPPPQYPFAGHAPIRWILIRLRCGRYRGPGRRRLNPRDIPRVCISYRVPVCRVCLLLASLGKAVARTIVRAKSQNGYRLLNEIKDNSRTRNLRRTDVAVG
jgi:hypothetical protein